MPTFSSSSRAQLATCHADLQRLFEEVVKHYDCKVVEGFRGEEAQNYAFEHGFSQKRWPEGNHNHSPSTAADVYPFPIPKKIDNPVYFRQQLHFAGYVKATANALGIPIRCGLDWDNDNDFTDSAFIDAPHFELKGV